MRMTNCGNNVPAVIHMPSRAQNSNKFTKLSRNLFVILVIYFDFESFLRPVSGFRGPNIKAFTQVMEKYEPFGFRLAVIDYHSSKPKQVDSS